MSTVAWFRVMACLAKDPDNDSSESLRKPSQRMHGNWLNTTLPLSSHMIVLRDFRHFDQLIPVTQTEEAEQIQARRQSETIRVGLQASRWLSGKESACQRRKHAFDPWVGKIPWRWKWQPTPVFLPGKFHGYRSLVGYSSLGCKESTTSEYMNKHTQTHTDTHTPRVGLHIEESEKLSKNQAEFRTEALLCAAEPSVLRFWVCAD